jgi:hypothetical protein
MADTVYTSFTKDIGTGIIDLDTDDIWVMLATNTYVPSTAHAKRSDITNEAAGTGAIVFDGPAQSCRPIDDVDAVVQ